MEDIIFRSSPKAEVEYTSKLFYNTTVNKRTKRRNRYSDDNENMISLDDFIHEIPYTIAAVSAAEASLASSSSTSSGYCHNQSDHDAILELLRCVELQEHELNRYKHIDPTCSYTRNLIATDHRSYTLLLLCWNPNQYSPIHDHPCDGCWMKVLKGQIHEVRYNCCNNTSTKEQVDEGKENTNDDNDVIKRGTNSSGPALVCTQESIGTVDDVIFIKDSIGLHKVGNPSSTELAITLHLYCPPFEECKVWLNETVFQPNSIRMNHYFSEYGSKTIQH